VIIAVGSNFSYVDKCIKECLKLPEVTEIIVIPDIPLTTKYTDKRVKFIISGKIGPGKKRDIGADAAAGDILAFIDDDAYPASTWLASAKSVFLDAGVVAVGGPAVTALEDDFLQRASGHVFSSPLCSGSYDFRYVPRNQRENDDLPSVNLLVRKKDFQALGGFDTSFWPGEDTKLCLDLTHKLKKKMIYHPGVLVYHHRRNLFTPHLRQTSNYALHRGFFVKKFPETSLRISYFLPSLFLIWLFGSLILGFLFSPIHYALLTIMSVYLLVAFAYGYFKEGLRMGAYVAIGTLATHITYGAFFLLGLIAPTLKR